MTASTNPNPLATVMPGAGTSFAIQEQEIAAGQIGSTAAKPGFLQVIQKTLAAADIISMFTTGIIVIPAPGTGKSIIVNEYLFRMTRTSTQFTGGGVAQLQYNTTGNNGGTAIGATIAASVITGAAGVVDTIVYPAANITAAQNAPVAITNATGVFAAGTGTALVTIWYSII